MSSRQGRALVSGGLAAAFAAGLLAPPFGAEWPWDGGFVSSAYAEDDDFGDSDSDDGDSDSDIAVAPIEFIVATPLAADIDRLAAAGFTILAQDDVALLDAEVARLGLPPGIDPAAAEALVEQIVPGAAFGENSLYRPQELACGEAGCAAFTLAGWPQRETFCAAQPVVGLLDGGVNADHSALSAAQLEIESVVAADRPPASKVHGTALAVLLAGAADSRTPGLLPRARLLAMEAFHRLPDGSDGADAFDLARGLDRLAASGVPVANLSFSGPDNVVFRNVVAAALAEGMTLVAAVGNSGPRAEPLYPAAYEGVIGVTAIDRDKRVYRQAAQGPHVDFAAPGVRLWTAASVSGGRIRSGTSYAAPFVTAAFAVEQARSGERGEALIATLAARATDLGEAGRDPVFGWGLPPAPDCSGADAAN